MALAVECKNVSKKYNKDILEKLVGNKNILSKESIGNIEKYHVFDDFSKDEIYKLRVKGIEISSVNLQDLFIEITKKK